MECRISDRIMHNTLLIFTAASSFRRERSVDLGIWPFCVALVAIYCSLPVSYGPQSNLQEAKSAYDQILSENVSLSLTYRFLSK